MPFLPPHFTVYELDIASFTGNGMFLNFVDEESVSRRMARWIYNNLEGRYFVGQVPNKTSLCFGFEIPQEATYFGLVASSLVNKKD